MRNLFGWLCLAAAMCVFLPRAFTDRMTFKPFVVVLLLVAFAWWGLYV